MQTLDRGDHLLHVFELSDPNLQLDLTSDRWLLKDGQASDVLGLDVVLPNRLRPERGRKRVGPTAPSVSPALVMAFPGQEEAKIETDLRYVVFTSIVSASPTSIAGQAECILAGGVGAANVYTSATGVITVTNTITQIHANDRVVVHNPSSHRGVYTPSAVTGTTITITSGLGNTTLTDWAYLTHRDFVFHIKISGVHYLVKSPRLFINDGAWPLLTTTPVTFDEDERGRGERYNEIFTTASLFGQTDNALQLTYPIFGSIPGSKFTLPLVVTGDLRGLWVTNGQKFWLLQGSTWKLKLDLTGLVEAGTRWRMARIHTNRVMIVSSRHAPRVIYLNAADNPAVADDLNLGGCLAPRKPNVEGAALGSNTQPSWGMRAVTTPDGALTSGGVNGYRVQVRAVNLIDDLESEFVDVVEDLRTTFPTTLSPLDLYVKPAAASSAIQVYPAHRDTLGFFPGITHRRWSHIEVWHTQSDGLVYFLEARIALNQQPDGTLPKGFVFNESPTNTSADLSIAVTGEPPVQVADTLLTGFVAKTSADSLAGRLPPMCKDIAHLGGVTFCFGAAGGSVINPPLFARDYLSRNGDAETTLDVFSDTSAFNGYVFQSQDKLEIFDGGIDAGGTQGVVGDYTIEGVVGAQDLFAATFHQGLVANSSDDPGAGTDILSFLSDNLPSEPTSGTLVRLEFDDDVVRLDFLAPVPTTGDIVRVWFDYTSGTGASTITLMPYIDVNSVTTTGQISQTLNSGDIGRFLDFAITGTFIAQLGAQTHGGWAARLVIGTSGNFASVNEVRKFAPLSPLDMVAGFRAAFGSVLDDLRPPRAVIKRTFIPEWPRIMDDEQVHHSRIDKFAPESFLDTPLTLSRRGDVFRRAIGLSGSIAVIMDQAVHLIFLDSTGTPRVSTISDSGDGTPWQDSVIQVGSLVLWANLKGIQVLRTTNDPNIEGERGTISILGTDRFRTWFEAVFNAGADVQAGSDTLNGCVRFRRSDTGQVLQYSYRTDRFTLLDDDTGFFYSTGLTAITGDSGVRLYSVTAQGTVFEVNRAGSYTGVNNYTVVAGDTITTTSLQLLSGSFDATMLGEAVRIVVAGVESKRTITVVTTVINPSDKITWDSAVSGFAAGSIVRIGAVRFRVKFAPLQSPNRSSVNQIQAVRLRAIEPTGSPSITVRAYRDLQPAAVSSSVVAVFDPFVAGRTEDDRASGVVAQGRNLELQLEQLEAAKSFAIEHLQVKMQSEQSEAADRDST